MKTYKETLEEGFKLHPMAVHVLSGIVAAVGHKVNPDHVKIGDKVSSSDMDDLNDAGHKVKEL